jgi:chitinase
MAGGWLWACGSDGDPSFSDATTGSVGGMGTGGSAIGGAGGGAVGGAGQGGFDPAEDPSAQINHPGDMECRVAGMSVPFVGVATDPQEGALTGGSLVWTCSIDGQIGTGDNFMFTPQQVGTHVITLVATDSDGNTGSDTVTLMVQQQCP